ncbi:MAG TPA: hypothetical protein VN814_14245 [Caulobacteraceae bacterium]|nr:hypothetical protein [Caulobacteraceae bacterium]
MRVMLKMQVPVDAGNKAVSDGSLPKVIQEFLEKAKPEAAYFGAFEGKRTMIAVFDLASPAQIPPLAEPFFMGLNATFDLTPVMDAADLQTGLSGV